jgi:hypothetical protein
VRPTRVELTGLLGPERDDAYTQNLRTFGYSPDLIGVSSGLALSVLRHRLPWLWLGGRASAVGMPRWSQGISGSTITEKLDWSVVTLEGVGRAEQPFGTTGFLSRLSIYGQLSAGLGIGNTKLTGGDLMTYSDTYFGPALGVGAGLHADSPYVRGFGLTAGYEYDYAPVIKDLIGDTHGSGGHRVTLALTFAF